MVNIILLIVVSIAFIALNIEIFKRAKKYSKSKNLNSIMNKFSIFTTYAFIIFLSYIFIDLVVFKFLGHGYTSDYKQEYIYRAPSPYDMFSGRSKSLDHNSDGFRGKEFKMANDKQLSIAFFGGSTGYNGNPPIINLISEKLKSDNIDNIIYNFSSASSNHNQHLHRLLKYSYFKFDVVIFYGGYNETFQTLLADPRPGYPFNFWIKNELNELKFMLIKYFSLPAEIDKKMGSISGISKIRKKEKVGTDEWIEKLLKNYAETLYTTRKLTNNFIEPNRCNKSFFIAVYQPISHSKMTHSLLKEMEKGLSEKIINKTKEMTKKYSYFYDLSNLYEQKMFTDSVHVTDEAKNIMASELSNIIKKEMLNKCI